MKYPVMPTKRCLVWLFILALVVCASSANAQVRAWLDRSVISLGETVTLNVEGNGSGEPDFSGLENDFRIVHRSSASQMNIVNGAMARTNLWAAGLEPLREGVITIGPIAFGNQQTEPLTLTVRPMARGSAADGDDVFLEVEADNASPYVQQQIGYTVRLFYAVSLLEGNLDEPAGDGLQVRRVGQDANYSREIQGRRYNVVERRYVLTPERSGALSVRGVTFRGRLARGTQSPSFFSQGVPVTVGSDAIALEVRAAPANAPAPWLPARDLVLRDDAGRMQREVKVGDALELTLMAEARGLSAEQMPELTLPPIPGAEIYPDQETRETREADGFVIGKRTRKFAIVPLREGRLEFPERSLSWWNVETDKVQRSTLPAFVLDVQAAASAAIGAVSLNEGQSSNAVAPSLTVSDASVRLWKILASVFALAWLATLAAWRLSARRAATAPPDEPATARSASWRPELAHALARNDLSAARRALLRLRPELRSLEVLAVHLVHEDQREAVKMLERVLYRGDDSDGLVERLRSAFARRPEFIEQSGFATETQEGLPPLYPPAR